jgi:hypothetical protein
MKSFGLIFILILCVFCHSANAQQKCTSSVHQTISLTLLNNLSIVDGSKILSTPTNTETTVLSSDAVQSQDKWIIQNTISAGEIVISTENFSKNTDVDTAPLNSSPVRVSTVSSQ